MRAGLVVQGDTAERAPPRKRQAEGAQALVQRSRVLPALDLFESLRVTDDDVFAHEEDVLTVGRKEHLGELSFGVVGPGDLRGNFVVLEVVTQKLGRADLETIAMLGGRLGDEKGVAIPRLDRASPGLDVLVAILQREGVDDLLGCHVDNVETLHVCALNIEAATVRRQIEEKWGADGERNLVALHKIGLVDDVDAALVGTGKDRAFAARATLGRSR